MAAETRWVICRKVAVILNSASNEPGYDGRVVSKSDVYNAYKLLEPFIPGVRQGQQAAIQAALDVMKNGNYYGSPATTKPKLKTPKLADPKQQQSLFAEFEGYKTEKSKRKAITIMMWAFREIDDAELTGKAFEAVKLLHSPSKAPSVS